MCAPFSAASKSLSGAGRPRPEADFRGCERSDIRRARPAGASGASATFLFRLVVVRPMSKGTTNSRPEARTAKGFRDIEAPELAGLNEMVGKIRTVYERYGFEALETPAIEYSDALGKFPPDQDRPNAGVF